MKVLPKLLQKKYRDEYGCFLVEGKKGVQDALESSAEVMQVMVSQGFARAERAHLSQPLFPELDTNHHLMTLTDHEFSLISDTSTPPGIAAVVRKQLSSLEQITQSQRCLILEDIRDPGNLGTIIRTADWFGIDSVFLLGGADPFQPKVVRSSMGSLFHVPLRVAEDPISELETLKKSGMVLLTTLPEEQSAPKGTALHQLRTTLAQRANAPIGLVFGNESRGTSATIDELATGALSIPQYGSAESLNVALSVAILLHELRAAAV